MEQPEKELTGATTFAAAATSQVAAAAVFFGDAFEGAAHKGGALFGGGVHEAFAIPGEFIA